jgi:sugar phosphate permease
MATPQAAVSPMAVAASSSVEESAYSKVTWRLLPFLFAAYVFAYLDRVNVGFAKLQMLTDLKLSETVYGFGAGIFFVGYFLFEVPSNLIMYRVGARIWIGRIMATWGALAIAMMFVKTPTSFYVVRFLLGMAEAGFIPGILFYLTYWYPAKRRGRISALFLMGIPVSGVIGGPLSGYIISSFSGSSGLAGWQWLFLLEGVPSVILGFFCFFYLPAGIRSSNWLTDPEKSALEARIKEEEGTKQHHSISDAFGEPKVWLLAITYAFFLMGLYGVSFWLPSLIKAAGVKGPLNIGLVTAIPYGCGVIMMLVTGKLSDTNRERRWHLAIPGLLGALGLFCSTLVVANPPLAIAAFALGTAGVCTTVSQFWNLPPAFLTGVAAAAGIAFVNAVGNISGFVAPYMVGWIKDTTGSTNNAIYVIAGSMCIASALVFVIPARMVNK